MKHRIHHHHQQQHTSAHSQPPFALPIERRLSRAEPLLYDYYNDYFCWCRKPISSPFTASASTKKRPSAAPRLQQMTKIIQQSQHNATQHNPTPRSPCFGSRTGQANPSYGCTHNDPPFLRGANRAESAITRSFKFTRAQQVSKFSPPHPPRPTNLSASHWR